MRNPESLDSTVDSARHRRLTWPALAVRRWHRAVGIFAAVFLLFLAVTGLLLMHSDRLGLPAAQINHRSILSWYGIRPPPPPIGFQSGGHWISQLGPRLYFDSTEIPLADGVLLGVFAGTSTPGASEWLIITDTEILILDDSGTVIERLGRAAGLPAGLTAAGRDADGQIVLASAAGRFRFDAELADFVPVPSNGTVHWSSGGTPPGAVAEAITRAYRGDGLSIERLVLDLHSGRVFGMLGVIVVNLASLALLFLAASGLFMWLRRGRRERRPPP